MGAERGDAGRSAPTGMRVMVGVIAAWLLLSAAIGLGLPRIGDVGTLVIAVLFLGAGLVTAVWAIVISARALRAAAVLVWLVLGVLLAYGVYGTSIALAATHPPHAQSPTTLAGAEHVRMHADGADLSGWYLPGTNGAGVVLRHGAGSTAGAVAAHAEVLHAAGFSVLATDARAHGDSGGPAMDLGWYGDDDIRAAVDLLVSGPEVTTERVAVVGLSMGGEEAIGAAAADPRIGAVVAEGVTGRTATDKTWLPAQYGLAGVVQNVLDAGTYTLIDLFTPAAPPIALEDAVRKLDADVFLIVAGDEADEGFVAERLAAAAPDRVSVWVVAGAAHTAALRVAPDEWQRRVTAFLLTALGGAP